MTRVKERKAEEVMERVSFRKGEENQDWGDMKSVANPYYFVCWSHAVVFLCGPSLKLIFYGIKDHCLWS